MFAKLLAIASLAAVAVNAQTTTGVPSSITPCALGCISNSLSAGGCTGLTDLNCLCTSTAFQQAAQQCLTSQCTAADAQAAQALQSQECAAVSSGSVNPSSATSAASSLSSAASSAGSSIASSLSSDASSVLSSLSSRASSVASSASNALSSATNPPTTSTTGTTGSSGSGAVGFGIERGQMVGLAVGLVGVLVGAGWVL